MRSYQAVHDRLQRRRGPASLQRCYYCADPAQEWSYDGTDPDEQTVTRSGGETVVYSADDGRYVPACRSCHRRIDGKRRSTHCRYGHPFTILNTARVVRTGRGVERRCRTCERERDRKRRAAA